MRPFFSKKDDRGYKDAIVWLSVVEIAAKSGDQVAFLTNYRGFFDGDKIHEDLIADLLSNEVDPDAVALHRTVREFLETSMYAQFDSSLEIRGSLKLLSDRLELNWVTSERLDLAIGTWMDRAIIRPNSLGRIQLHDFEGIPVGLTIENVSRIDEIRVKGLKVADGSILVYGTASAEVALSITVEPAPSLYSLLEFQLARYEGRDSTPPPPTAQPETQSVLAVGTLIASVNLLIDSEKKDVVVNVHDVKEERYELRGRFESGYPSSATQY